MNEKKCKKSDVQKFVDEGQLCRIIDLNGKKYAQVDEIILRPKQLIAVVELYGSETFITIEGRVVVYIPDEGRYFGVLVEGRSGPRWSQFVPSDIAINVTSGWDADEIS